MGKHGYWLKDEHGDLYCSECNSHGDWMQIATPYCAMCGASMSEETKDTEDIDAVLDIMEECNEDNY